MSAQGTYALLLHLDRPQKIVIGALGKLGFAAGWYLYLGSAYGPGGLAARLARHRRRKDKRFHWHIDYIRAVTELVEVWTSSSAYRQECHWAAATAKLPDANVVAPRFGASDCGCETHLFHFSRRPNPSDFTELFQAELERESIVSVRDSC